MNENKCLVCEKIYKSSRSLQNHLNRSKTCKNHEVKCVVSCDGCKKEFCSKYTLQRHYDVCIEYKSVKTKSEEVEKMKELIISLRTEVAIYKSKCEDLKQQNTELLKIINKQNI